ncbi:hypothetical protein POTOM_059858 [Populus tomentosa]|uniref:Uncharacterized protein n=1 Tax=Populus tomentosa TaxID=118781 RepID=A0A8X7XNW7_POPTO|nr:hypothetical protein POTOM_059858 [Populus tomentosa]
MAVMAGSSPDEELKKLEKIVADKDQELEVQQRVIQLLLEHKNRELEHQQRVLEHKDRELEQLRSSLTASAPQQGIDSLPRSLPTQIDDQGIN